jgi:transcriptional regulator with XRE-family HTH domain
VGSVVVPERDRSEELAVARAFGERVRAARRERGMTQEQLAEAAGIHPTFVSNLERGYRVATIVTLVRVARGLGVTAGSLVDDPQ